MKAEKRKITVKHYLNKRAKEKTLKGQGYFPLYIQIIVNARKAQLKSRINEHLGIYRSDIERFTNNDSELSQMLLSGYFSDKLLAQVLEKQTFPIYHLLMDEIEVLKRIIRLHNPFTDPDFALNNISFEYQMHVAEITRVLDDRIKESYINELKAIFLRSIDDEEKREIFRIVNYLINFVNWGNTFNNFYESTMEIMPNEMKAVDNLLSKELRTTIKSFVAYHTQVNVLKRFFEKRELGKISTLSYLDWQTEIKAFLQQQFVNLYGEHKALEYIICLDNILAQAISVQSAQPEGAEEE